MKGIDKEAAMRYLNYRLFRKNCLRHAHMRQLRATVMRVLAITLLPFASPPTARAIDVPYSVQTSTPEGKAVCKFDGTVKNSDVADLLKVTITPAAGQEAQLKVNARGKRLDKTAAGIEESCDIYDPDQASDFVIFFIPPESPFKFQAVVKIHAHPQQLRGR
jgi:hypothetical protein